MREKLRSQGIEVRVNRGETKTVCPKCSDSRKNKKDPCLSVNVTDGIWNCHNCGWAGSIQKRNEKVYEVPNVELKNLGDRTVNWFAARGITNQTLLRYKVTEGVEYMPQVSTNRTVIQFNYYLHGSLVNIKFRDAEKNFKLVSGARLIPYGYDVANDNSDTEILICEGEIDCMSWYEAGIKNAVSVPNGASKGSQKLEWLDECFSLFDGKTVYLATDMDDAGMSLRDELARRLGKQNCMVVSMPLKDANEVLVSMGKDVLAECYRSANAYPVEGVEDAMGVHADVMRLYDEGTPRGFDTGFDMDDDFVWHAGQVTMVTGIPGHGKSTMIKNLEHRLSERHGWRWLIYSAEEAGPEFAVADMYQIISGKSFFTKNAYGRITKDELENLKPFVADHFKYYRMDNDQTIEAILDKSAEMVKRYGINGLVIDNMSTVEKGLSNQTDTRHHQIKNIMNDISRFARNYGVHVILVAHPRKMNEIKSGVYRVPNGYDIGDSSHWFNLPDNGMTVYRNMETGQAELHRWKVRFWYTGKTGVSFFNFNTNNSRFSSADRVNDGSDNTKFIGQPYAKDYASLPNPF